MRPTKVAAFAKVAWYLIVLGIACLIVVVLTHLCESFHLFPSMGWGRTHSAGHYLDLTAATIGLALLPSGLLLLLFYGWKSDFIDS